MEAKTYYVTDLEKYHKFRINHPDLPTFLATQLYRLRSEEDEAKFIENFFALAKKVTRGFKTWELGNHVILYYHKFELGLGIKFSRDTTEKEPNIINIDIIIFTLEIQW